jgi:hypothetical protein
MRVKVRGMSPDEGSRIVRREMDGLRARTYKELLKFFDAQVRREQGESGTNYEIETESFWDNREGKNVRVMVRLDAVEGWRRRLKIVDDFIMAPDGSFVGEGD